MKRILFISPQPFFQWRGSPIRVKFVLQAFSELGYQVDLLTLPFGENISLPNVRIYRVPNLFRVKNVAIGPSAVKALFDIVLLFKAISLLRKQRYDVIHGIEEAGFLALVLGRWFKAKVVFEKHSDPSSHHKGRLRNAILSVYAWIEGITARRADLIIGTGEGLANQIRRMAPKGEVFAIFDIPSSLVEADETAAQQIAHSLRRDQTETLVTFVGSFAVYQGIELLFESIRDVLKRDKPIRFVIIGGNDVEIEQRKSQLKEDGIEAGVTFVGKIPPDELPNYLRASDILLVPRHSGVNTPLKVLDYFKAGRAIVATDVPSNRLILDENTALFAQVSAQQYGEKIIALAENDTLRLALGEAGYQRYRDKYNFTTFKGLLGQAYQTIV